MKYVIQLNTGSLYEPSYKVEEIIQKLEYFNSHLEISMVLMGWYRNQEYNRTIVNWLKERNIKAILKLPIFSEITDLTKEDEFIYDNNKMIKNNHFYQGDKFDFVCPSSIKNIDYILDIYRSIDEGINFDGIFIDRIRYPAISINESAILGCQCEECKKYYQNINMNDIKSYKVSKRNGFIYQYEDQAFNQLIQIKRDIITSQVKRLSEVIHQENKILGIDTFSPMLADLVGQDLTSLNNYVDFIKPMNYLMTQAPAGIPYEVDTLPDELKNSLLNTWKEDYKSIESSLEMSKELLKLNNRITIGIDANYVKDICEVNDEYIVNHIRRLEIIGIQEVVLSWNAMLLENELIDQLSKIK